MAFLKRLSLNEVGDEPREHDHFGYSAAFLAAGAAAVVALAVFALWMPETAVLETKRLELDRESAWGAKADRRGLCIDYLGLDGTKFDA